MAGKQKDKKPEDMMTTLTEAKASLASLRMQRSLGSEVKPHQFKLLRRQVARIMTAINQEKRGL